MIIENKEPPTPPRIKDSRSLNLESDSSLKNYVYEVASKDSGKKYFVSHNRNHWTCTCKDFLFRSHDSNGYATGHKCKHIKQIMKQEGLP